MIRLLVFLIALFGNLTSSYAGSSRADRIISESGGGGGGGIIFRILDFSDFYALMPPDNPAPILGGNPVEFPNVGPTSGIIVPTSTSTFLLPAVGIYWVKFEVSINRTEDTGGSQLVATLNGIELPYTVVGVGRTGGPNNYTQLTGTFFVQTTVPNSTLSIISPPGSTPLLVDPFAGSSSQTPHPASAHLIILRLL